MSDLSKEEINKLLDDLAEGEDFHEEQPVKDELISRQAAIKYLMDNMTWYSEDGYETDEDEKKSAITSLINGVPSIQPVTGKWIERPHGLTSICECSKCGYIDKYYFDRGQSKFNYCPNCGFRMEVSK